MYDLYQADRIAEDSARYTIGTIIAQFIGIFTSILMRRYLTPEMMGVWATFLVILNYALFSHLGIFTAAEVKIPFLRGKNRNEEIQNIRDIAFTFGILISLTSIIVLYIFSFLLKGSIPDYVILGIRMMSFIITATLLYNLYITMLRADKNFLLLSKATIFNSAAMLFFIGILAYYFKINGIYFATLFATLASWLYIKFNTKYKLKLHFRIGNVLDLSKIGIPLIIVVVAYTILLSIDKIMIIKMIGAKELGFYSIAILALTYANTFPKLFGIVIFPNMQEEFGRTNSKESILEYFKKPTFIMAYFFPALLAAAYFLIPILVNYILPKYILGIDSMKILLCGCFFISLVPLAHNYIIALNKQVILIPIILTAVSFGIALNYIIIKLNYGISGVALGTSVTYLAYFIVIFIFSLKHCEKWSEIYLFLFKVFIPFFYSVMIILIIEHFIKMDRDISKTLVQSSIFYLAYLPMLIYANKKSKIIPHIFKIFRKMEFAMMLKSKP